VIHKKSLPKGRGGVKTEELRKRGGSKVTGLKRNITKENWEEGVRDRNYASCFRSIIWWQNGGLEKTQKNGRSAKRLGGISAGG